MTALFFSSSEAVQYFFNQNIEPIRDAVFFAVTRIEIRFCQDASGAVIKDTQCTLSSWVIIQYIQIRFT